VASSRSQAQRHGDRLVVVEQEWRQRGARAEPVSAGYAWLCVDGITKAAQLGDVAPERAGRDIEPGGKLGARPFRLDLQQRQHGPAEGPYAEYPMAALVLHIHREAIHHGAEIALLRDLYLREAD